jgi:hypothetical protein
VSLDGWQLDGGVRVRLAEPMDMPRAVELVALAGVALESEIVQAVEHGIAAAALRATVVGGQEAFARHMAEQFVAHHDTDIRVVFQHVTLVLVAEHGTASAVSSGRRSLTRRLP